GAQGREDDPFDPLAVDTAAARRAGELQLENLKKKLKDPGVWKKMGWKDQEDADRFLEQARAYQEWLRQQEKATADNSTRPAVKNVLPSQAVRPVGPSVNQRRDPLELGDAQAPPEFREALRRFTTKPRE
ncbi:MAG TPA: hypothetical protein VEL76_27220, partial [Gemmataceae bacterium]|nr:hypothetical protein [Gemmataceae bacterium]